MITPPADYIFQRQRLWALRHEHRLSGSAGDRGRPAYTYTLDQNLFEPLGLEAKAEYAAGDGGELGREGPKPGKMQAVHSSSALSCNLFHYWRRIGRPGIVAAACGLSTRGLTSLTFEQQLPIDPRFRYTPNLDALFLYGVESAVQQIGVECKFSEAFSTYVHLGLKNKYLDARLDTLWSNLPTLRALGQELCPDNKRFLYLDAAQLIKHILALRRCSDAGCELLYVYYDVPGPQGLQHAEEVAEFIEVAQHDGVIVRSTTYQDVLIRLALDHHAEHRPYIDYMVERYL